MPLPDPWFNNPEHVALAAKYVNAIRLISRANSFLHEFGCVLDDRYLGIPSLMELRNEVLTTGSPRILNIRGLQEHLLIEPRVMVIAHDNLPFDYNHIRSYMLEFAYYHSGIPPKLDSHCVRCWVSLFDKKRRLCGPCDPSTVYPITDREISTAGPAYSGQLLGL